MSQALLKIKATKHPISEKTIGFRIQAAHPNMAGRNRQGEEIPSFAKKYLIAESSDEPSIETRHIDRFTDKLMFQNFSEFVIVSDVRDTL
jgi:hypothetical protein